MQLLRPLAATLLCVVLAAGCGRQGEGERCDPDNQDVDCESGLTCVSFEELVLLDEGAICCPADGSGSGVCSASIQLPTSGGEPADASSAPPPTSDAAPEPMARDAADDSGTPPDGG